MSEKICCICDALHPAPNIVKKKVSKCPALISQMLSRLKSPADLPAELKNYYDCSDFYEAFDGLLMSRRGLCVQNGEVIMQMCNSCCVSLSKKNGNSPPKFAVANGLYIGSLPDKFDDSTMTENAMVNLSQSTRFLSVYRGGKHTSLRSHAYFFRSDPAPPVKLLPRSVVGTGEIAVKIVGAMTPEQKIAATRKYQVRSDRIRNLLDWYYENNYLYNQLDEITGWEISTVPTRVVEDETSIPESSESTVHANALDENTWRFNASTPSHATVYIHFI
ncbi:Hypothetical protein PHPALM_15057 [Phytophthora palmivora]|uniref:DUF6570 domain-containing protein n=1 Tax=Phytophthora palmivora TaxID=4796 RepID=A0A2P4XT65_9STRA|nr:Hypothetical protein PHPALM_15057 [Phytophthora palmivora]